MYCAPLRTCVGIRFHHHAFGCHQRAGSLQLRAFFSDFDQAHAATSLQRKSGV